MDGLDPDCIFCKIIRHEIPAVIVFEDQDVLALQDANPQAPSHLLVIPKHHVEGLRALGAADAGWLGRLVACAPALAARLGIADRGFRVVINSGADGGQSVFHLHLHLLGGRALTWPPG